MKVIAKDRYRAMEWKSLHGWPNAPGSRKLVGSDNPILYSRTGMSKTNVQWTRLDEKAVGVQALACPRS
jgi:hypothetical protein